MRGFLAAAGAASVAAMSVASPQAYTLTANVLTVTGYTAGGTLQWDMSESFKGSYCSAQSGNTCTPVRYLSGLPVVGESDGLRALRSAIRTTPGPTVVLGYSQGALIAAEWMESYGDDWIRPEPEDLSFVLFGNSLRKYGGVRPAYDIDQPTPDSDYHVTDIAIEYDGAADFPDNPFNLLALANAFAGFQYVHIYGYDDVDLENDEKLEWTEGNTTYVLIRRENIPLLEPLRILGLDALADELNGPLKAIIDSAYDRDYPGLEDTSKRRVPTEFLTAADTEGIDEVDAEAEGDEAESTSSTVDLVKGEVEGDESEVDESVEAEVDSAESDVENADGAEDTEDAVDVEETDAVDVEEAEAEEPETEEAEAEEPETEEAETEDAETEAASSEDDTAGDPCSDDSGDASDSDSDSSGDSGAESSAE